MKVMAQKVGSGTCKAQMPHGFGRVIIIEAVEVVQAAAGFDVRHRFNIEYEYVQGLAKRGLAGVSLLLVLSDGRSNAITAASSRPDVAG